MTPPLLEVVGLHVVYGGVVAVHEVSFTVEAGEMVALLGANGAGKTSTLRALSGLVAPAAGAISFDGHDLLSRRPPEIARLGIAHVPEGRGLFGSLSVADNLRLGLYGAGRDGTADGQAAVARMYELFPPLRERREQPAGTMSGGQQQMLAVARALVQAPRLLVLDEMSMGLAPAVVEDLLAVIAGLRDDGMAVLLVEQFVEQALAVTDRAVLLEGGRVVASGRSAELARDEVACAYLGRDVGALEVPPAPAHAREPFTVSLPGTQARALHRRARAAGVDEAALLSAAVSAALSNGEQP